MRGNKDEQIENWRRRTQAELGRLYALPLAELAAEVMAKAFGPGGPGYVAPLDVLSPQRAAAVQHNLGTRMISQLFVSDEGYTHATTDDRGLRELFVDVVAEGLQQLEHASLVWRQVGNFERWQATRRGRAALERGEVVGILRAAGL